MNEILPKEDEGKILKYLNIEEDKLCHYMNLFDQWITTQNHLPQNFDETCRKKFMVWAKLDLEKAKKKFQTFCYNPITHKEFVGDRVLTPEADLKMFDFIYLIPMPKLTPQGYRVTMGKVFDADNIDIPAIVRGLAIDLEYRIHEGILVAGEVAVYDMQNLKPQHYAKLFTPTLPKFVKFCLLNYPFITKNVFIINCHPLLEKGIALCKTILPKKLADRITILSNPRDINKYISPECIPQDFGGTERSLEELQKLWKQFMLDQNDLFQMLNKSKPTGAIPEEFVSDENEFGVDGSFRKLNID